MCRLLWSMMILLLYEIRCEGFVPSRLRHTFCNLLTHESAFVYARKTAFYRYKKIDHIQYKRHHYHLMAAPKTDFDEDYYSVLEVSPSVSAKELKKEYYRLVIAYHPDNKPDASQEEKELLNRQMMVINAAYKV